MRIDKKKFIRKLLSVLTIIVVSASLFLYSCKKHEVYPITPHIEFFKFTKIPTINNIDSKGILNISFTDGDSDIGLKPEDTTGSFKVGSPYYYNFYIDYYEKQNDSFVKIDLPLTNNSRIPYIEPDEAERGIKGNIEIELFINNILSKYDTIMFKAFIYDRALHKSNVIETPEIVIKKK